MTNALHIRNLSVTYEHFPALTDINLDVEEGQFLGVLGPNGGGKSTLLKAVLGLIPYSGTIEIFGKPASGHKTVVGYVPQVASCNRLFPITVTEAVMTGFLKGGSHPFLRFGKGDRQRAMSLLETVEIASLADRQLSGLSGGEFQRLLIARALAADPRLLLLDEPTAGVDPASVEHIYRLLGDLNRELTVVLVTHDLMAVSSLVKRIACLNHTLVYHGEPELTQDTVNRLYGCPVDLVAHGVAHRVLQSHGGECHHD